MSIHERQRPETEAEETALAAEVRSAAQQLLLGALDLGWGCGEPIEDAKAWIDRAAEELGIESPARSTPKRRDASGATLSRRIWDRDGWTCRRCGGHAQLTVDHIIPRASGGSDDDDNLQTLCFSCNASKGMQ